MQSLEDRLGEALETLLGLFESIDGGEHDHLPEFEAAHDAVEAWKASKAA